MSWRVVGLWETGRWLLGASRVGPGGGAGWWAHILMFPGKEGDFKTIQIIL